MGPSLADTATGVNDFRYMKQWGYTNPDNTVPKAGKHPRGEAIQKFMDYETAQAVARANAANLGGRSDWTGEQIQANPWVVQKANDLRRRSNNRLSYEEAFQLANKTYKEYLDKFTLAATHEQLPGAASGHLPGLQAASEATKRAYFNHPASREGIAPGGRDALYASLNLEQAPGVAMQVRPTVPMEGLYKNSQGAWEFNPGEVARPMVSHVNTPEGKKIAPDDRKIVEMVEAFRALMNMQEMGVAHAVFPGSKVKDAQAINIPMGDQQPTIAQLQALHAAGAQRGVGDVASRGTAPGSGLTMTNFDPDTVPTGAALAKALRGTKKVPGLAQDITNITGARPEQVGIDSVAHFWTDEMKQGVGSAAMTDKMLQMFNDTPHIAAMLERSPYVPPMMKAKMERDDQFAVQLGDTVRRDLQNLRRIIAAGGDWINNVIKARAGGKIELPAIVLPMIGLPALVGSGEDQGEGR